MIIKAYHGTDVAEHFDSFQCPAYFTNLPEWAQGFGSKRVIEVSLVMDNPYILDGEEEGRHFEWDAEDIAEMQKQGHDSVWIQHPEGDVYTVFKPEQVQINKQSTGY